MSLRDYSALKMDVAPLNSSCLCSGIKMKQWNLGSETVGVQFKRLYLRVKGIVSKRLSISLKNVRDVFIFKP